MSKPAVKKRLERALAAAIRSQPRDLMVVDAATLGPDTFLVIDPDAQRVRVVHVCLGSVTKRETDVLEKFAGLKVSFYQRQAGKKSFSTTNTKPCQEGKRPG